jgi:hypothetical protein
MRTLIGAVVLVGLVGCGGGGGGSGGGAKTPVVFASEKDVAGCQSIGQVKGTRHIGDDGNDPIKRAAAEAGATHIVMQPATTSDTAQGIQLATGYKCGGAAAGGGKDGG